MIASCCVWFSAALLFYNSQDSHHKFFTRCHHNFTFYLSAWWNCLYITTTGLLTPYTPFPFFYLMPFELQIIYLLSPRGHDLRLLSGCYSLSVTLRLITMETFYYVLTELLLQLCYLCDSIFLQIQEDICIFQGEDTLRHSYIWDNSWLHSHKNTWFWH